MVNECGEGWMVQGCPNEMEQWESVVNECVSIRECVCDPGSIQGFPNECGLMKECMNEW
jgi:hypothetical protein